MDMMKFETGYQCPRFIRAHNLLNCFLSVCFLIEVLKIKVGSIAGVLNARCQLNSRIKNWFQRFSVDISNDLPYAITTYGNEL